MVVAAARICLVFMLRSWAGWLYSTPPKRDILACVHCGGGRERTPRGDGTGNWSAGMELEVGRLARTSKGLQYFLSSLA